MIVVVVAQDNTDAPLIIKPRIATIIAWLYAISTGFMNRSTLSQTIIKAKMANSSAPANPPNALTFPVPKLYLVS